MEQLQGSPPNSIIKGAIPRKFGPKLGQATRSGSEVAIKKSSSNHENHTSATVPRAHDQEAKDNTFNLVKVGWLVSWVGWLVGESVVRLVWSLHLIWGRTHSSNMLNKHIGSCKLLWIPIA